MLISFEIQNFRTLRHIKLDFGAIREDLSETRPGQDGEEVRLLRAGDQLIVPIKNIIGLSSFGKSNIMDALETAIRISDGDGILPEIPGTLYDPCLEDPEGPSKDISYRLDFSYQAGSVFIISHRVSYNARGITSEELFFNGVSLYRLENAVLCHGGDLPEVFKRLKAGDQALLALGHCLETGENGEIRQKSTWLSAMQDHEEFLTLAKLAGHLRSEVSFTRAAHLQPGKVVEEFNAFIDDLMVIRDSSRFTAEEHRELTAKTFLGKISTVFDHVCNVDTIWYGPHPKTGEVSLWCEHKLPGDGIPYMTKLENEGTSHITLFILLLRCLRATFFGSTAVIDDFNLHIPSFAQLFLLKIFKSENNTGRGQLIAVHYGDRIMLPDGDECADEVCCLKRSPEHGTEVVDGPRLKSSEDVTFCNVKHRPGSRALEGMGLPREERTEKLRTVKKSRRKKKDDHGEDEFYFELDDGESC